MHMLNCESALHIIRVMLFYLFNKKRISLFTHFLELDTTSLIRTVLCHLIEYSILFYFLLNRGAYTPCILYE